MRIWFGAVLTAAGACLAVPAAAECLGSCMDGLVAALVSMLVYGLIGIVLLVMLIRVKWRRAGLWGLGIVAVLALGVPLVSQAWVAWTLRGVEGRERVGDPPALSGRVPLLITPDAYCDGNACAAVLEGRGAVGVHVLLTRALDGMDLTQAVPLADLPLEVWVQTTATGEPLRRVLTLPERQEAARRIDYLVVTSWPYYPADPGPVEAALRANPGLPGMGPTEAVRLLLAPLDPAVGILSLAKLQPDLLDLNLQDRALAIPLAPKNDQPAGNRSIGVDEAARAICPIEDGEPRSVCRSLLER